MCHILEVLTSDDLELLRPFELSTGAPFNPALRNVQTNSRFIAFELETHTGQTDGQTNGKARTVMRCISMAE